MKITLTVDLDTGMSLEAIKTALTKGVYWGLDREGSHIASPSGVKIEFLSEAETFDLTLPIPIKEEDYEEDSVAWYYNLTYKSVSIIIDPGHFDELMEESGVFRTKEEAMQFENLCLGGKIKFNELKQTWELI